MNVAYFDTSALLKQYVTEIGSAWVRAYPCPIGVSCRLCVLLDHRRSHVRFRAQVARWNLDTQAPCYGGQGL